MNCQVFDDRLLHSGLSAENAETYLKGNNGYHGLFLLRTGKSKKNTFTISVRYHASEHSFSLAHQSVCLSASLSVNLSLMLFSLLLGRIAVCNYRYAYCDTFFHSVVGLSYDFT